MKLFRVLSVFAASSVLSLTVSFLSNLAAAQMAPTLAAQSRLIYGALIVTFLISLPISARLFLGGFGRGRGGGPAGGEAGHGETPGSPSAGDLRRLLFAIRDLVAPGRSPGPVEPQDGRSLRRYLEAVSEEALLQRGWFIPLRVARRALAGRSGQRRSPEVAVESESLRLEEALREQSRVLLVGEPGAGKSVMLRRLWIDGSRQALAGADEPNALPWIPCLVDLAEYETWYDTKPLRHRFEEIQSLIELGCSFASEAALAERRFLLLLDGLDEIPPGRQPAFLRSLREFVHRYPWHAYVISTRPGPNLKPLKALRFGRLDLLPVTADHAKRYLRGLLPEDLDVDRFVARLHESLMALAENPLFLSIISRIDPERLGRPQRKGPLLDLYVRALLERETAGAGGEAEDLESLIGEGVRLSQTMHLEGRGVGAGWLPRLARKAAGSNQNARALAIFERSGLLRRGRGKARFTHSIFQDYFIAVDLVDKCKLVLRDRERGLPGGERRESRRYRRILKDRVQDPASEQAVALMLDLVEEADRELFVREIELPWNPVLAARHSESLQEPTEIRDRIVRRLLTRVGYARLWGRLSVALLFLCVLGPYAWVLAGMPTTLSERVVGAWFDFLTDHFPFIPNAAEPVSVLFHLGVMLALLLVIYEGIGLIFTSVERYLHRHYLEPALLAVAVLRTRAARGALALVFQQTRDDWFMVREFRDTIEEMLAAGGGEGGADRTDLPLVRLQLLRGATDVEHFESLLAATDESRENRAILATQMLAELVGRQPELLDAGTGRLQQIVSDPQRPLALRRAAYRGLRRLGIRSRRPVPGRVQLRRSLERVGDWLGESSRFILSLVGSVAFWGAFLFAMTEHVRPVVLLMNLAGWVAFLVAVCNFRSDGSVVWNPLVVVWRLLRVVLFVLTSQPAVMLAIVARAGRGLRLWQRIKAGLSVGFGVWIVYVVARALLHSGYFGAFVGALWVAISLWSMSYLVLILAGGARVSGVAEFALRALFLPFDLLFDVSRRVAKGVRAAGIRRSAVSGLGEIVGS